MLEQLKSRFGWKADRCLPPLILLPLIALMAFSLPTPSAAQQSFTLGDLLEIGRKRNPDLLALRAEGRALDANRRDSGRFQNPELEYSTGEGEPFEDPEKRSLRGFSVSQTIENPLVRHYRLGSMRMGVQAANENLRFTTLEVEYEIRLHFFRILYLQKLLGVTHLNEDALDEVRALTETRARVGEVRELEATRLRVEHMRSQNRVHEVELELSQYRQHLNMFLGNALPADFVLSGGLTSDFMVPDLQQLQAEALPRHPLLLQAARRREGAEQRLRASQFSWLPDPVVSATSAKEMDGDVLKWGVGFQIPLWNQSRAAVQRERETLRQAEHQEEGLLMELEAGLTIYHNHLLLSQKMLDLFQNGLLEEAEMSMQIAETSYREGEISLVEYLDARRTFQSIQIEFQQALYDWNRGMAELDRAAGGGVL